MDAKKIAKNTGKGAGIVAMAFLAGAAAYAQAEQETRNATLRRRPFQPRFSDEHDEKQVVITSGDDFLKVVVFDDLHDDMFMIVDSTVKGCKPGRIVTFKNPSVARDITRALQQNVYMRESAVREKLYLYQTYEPLLFSREDKVGDLVPSFFDKGWTAELAVEATL